jgi:hypothetical protein
MASVSIGRVVMVVVAGAAIGGLAAHGIWLYNNKQWPFDQKGVQCEDPKDPICAALARDTTKLQQLERRLAEVRVSADIEEPWVIAARELEVDALYDNQTGPINYFYRDPHFLQLESLLRGMTPSQLRCIQVERQADLLSQAAQIVLDASRDLETPEAQRFLADRLWDSRHLAATMRTDNRALESVRSWTAAWGAEADQLIDDLEEDEAKRRLRESYSSAVRVTLARQGWPWDQSPSLVAQIPARLDRDHGLADGIRAERHAAHQARVQVAAIVLREIGHQRQQLVRDWRSVLRELSGKRANEVVESLSGLLALPRNLRERFTQEDKAIVLGRIDEHLTGPAGLPEARNKLLARLKSFPEQARSKITDELDSPYDAGRGKVSPIPGSEAANTDTFRAALIKDLDQSMAIAVGEGVLLVAGLVFLMAPEPLFTKIAAAFLFAVDTTIEAVKVKPRWRRSTMIRLASVEAVGASAIGSSSYGEVWFADNTVALPASEQSSGVILDSERQLWNWLRDKTRSW